jgi:Flp pilus assembly protein TadG
MRCDKGSVNLMVIVFLAILISSLTVAINIGFLTLQKSNLQKVTDQAALAAVQEIDLAAYYQNGLTQELALNRINSERAAREFIKLNSRFQNKIDSEVLFRGGEITLNNEVLVNLPIAPQQIAVVIRASASARLVVGF